MKAPILNLEPEPLLTQVDAYAGYFVNNSRCDFRLRSGQLEVVRQLGAPNTRDPQP